MQNKSRSSWAAFAFLQNQKKGYSILNFSIDILSLYYTSTLIEQEQKALF
jgi:hypothetical protein